MPELATPAKYNLPALIFSPLNPASYLKMDVPKMPQDTRALASAALFKSIGDTLGKLPERAIDSYRSGQKQQVVDSVRTEYEQTKKDAALQGDDDATMKKREDAIRRLADFQTDKEGNVTVKPRVADPLLNQAHANYWQSRADNPTQPRSPAAPKQSLYEKQSDVQSYDGDPTAPAYELEPAANPVEPPMPSGGQTSSIQPWHSTLTRGAQDGATRPDAITSLNPDFGQRLAKMISEAPGDIHLYSGYRSEARQKELWDNALAKYGSESEARKWVAPPGHSNHNHGTAADLRFGDGMREWAHANADKYGLNFRLSNEPWHIEPSSSPRRVAQNDQAAPPPPDDPNGEGDPQVDAWNAAPAASWLTGVDPQAALASVDTAPPDEMTVIPGTPIAQAPAPGAAPAPMGTVEPGTVVRRAQPLSSVDVMRGKSAPLMSGETMTDSFNENRTAAGMPPLANVDLPARSSSTAKATQTQSAAGRTGRFKNTRTGAIEMWENGKLTNVLLPGANTWRAVKQSAQPKTKEYDSPEALIAEAQQHGLVPDDITQNPTGKWSAGKFKQAPTEPKLDRAMQKQLSDLRAEGAEITTMGKTQEEVASQIAAWHKANETLTDVQLKHINDLQSKYMRESPYQKYVNVSDGINNAIAASKLKTGIGDKTLIEEGQRILNPGTAVAAQTMQNFAHSKGFLEKLSPAYLQEHFTKGAIFTDSQRQDYISIIKGALMNRSHEMDEQRERYLKMAKAARVKGEVVEPFFENPYSTAAEKFGKDVPAFDVEKWTPQTGATSAGKPATTTAAPTSAPAAPAVGMVMMTKGGVTRSVSPAQAEILRTRGWTNAQP